MEHKDRITKPLAEQPLDLRTKGKKRSANDDVHHAPPNKVCFPFFIFLLLLFKKITHFNACDPQTKVLNFVTVEFISLTPPRSLAQSVGSFIAFLLLQPEQTYC